MTVEYKDAIGTPLTVSVSWAVGDDRFCYRDAAAPDILAAIEQNAELWEAVSRFADEWTLRGFDAVKADLLAATARAEAAEKERDALRAQVEAMRLALTHIQQWDMLNPPSKDLADAEWIRAIVNAALGSHHTPLKRCPNCGNTIGHSLMTCTPSKAPAADPPPAPSSSPELRPCVDCGRLVAERDTSERHAPGCAHRVQPAPSGFVPGARVRVREDAQCNDGHRGRIGAITAAFQQNIIVRFDDNGDAITDWLPSDLDLLPATPAAPVREDEASGWRRVSDDTAFAPPFGTIRACDGCGCLVAGGPTRCVWCAHKSAPAREEPAMSPADAEELRAWRSLREWTTSLARRIEVEKGNLFGWDDGALYGANATPAALCRALGLEGWT